MTLGLREFVSNVCDAPMQTVECCVCSRDLASVSVIIRVHLWLNS